MRNLNKDLASIKLTHYGQQTFLGSAFDWILINVKTKTTASQDHIISFWITTLLYAWEIVDQICTKSHMALKFNNQTHLMALRISVFFFFFIAPVKLLLRRCVLGKYFSDHAIQCDLDVCYICHCMCFICTIVLHDIQLTLSTNMIDFCRDASAFIKFVCRRSTKTKTKQKRRIP